MTFNGANMSLGQIARLSNAKTRMVSAENVYGEKGKGGMAEYGDTPQPEVARIGQPWKNPLGACRELGRGWKVRPCTWINCQNTTTIMDVEGPGVIQHIWITVRPGQYRDLIIRFYWDDETTPSVEAPIGDFFCNGWQVFTQINALPINVNPSSGLNCFFPMPFRRRAKITVENRSPADDVAHFFYQITYALTQIDDDDACFHAQFRRTNPVPDKQPYTIVDGITGRGQYVGTYMGWQQNTGGWWGEGEAKFYIDGDGEFPTVCGTGTEDYFGGAWSFGKCFSAPFMGYPLGDSETRPGTRHGLYRFHIMDPIRFETDLRATMQALGWGTEGRYRPLQDDICSVAYWYQSEPHAPFPQLPERDLLTVR